MEPNFRIVLIDYLELKPKQFLFFLKNKNSWFFIKIKNHPTQGTYLIATKCLTYLHSIHLYYLPTYIWCFPMYIPMTIRVLLITHFMQFVNIFLDHLKWVLLENYVQFYWHLLVLSLAAFLVLLASFFISFCMVTSCKFCGYWHCLISSCMIFASELCVILLTSFHIICMIIACKLYICLNS